MKQNNKVFDKQIYPGRESCLSSRRRRKLQSGGRQGCLGQDAGMVQEVFTGLSR